MSKIQTIRKSIRLKLIRHAESGNNEVYSDAHRLFHWGSPNFDEVGWLKYVNEHRSADPGLSTLGAKQAEALGEYLSKELENEASTPIFFVVSPMRRAVDTIMPTIRSLNELKIVDDEHRSNKCEVFVHAHYHEVEGCHLKSKPAPGMNQIELSSLFERGSSQASENVSFVGFSDVQEEGWYSHGEGAETRIEAEERASKFYLWLCEYLDSQLKVDSDDVFDASVRHINPDGTVKHKKRRTVVMLGHGEFMGYVLKRIIAGFGYSIEHEGVPHRSAMVHFNTGITELEYFGAGRFLLMYSNQTSHLDSPNMRTGGGLKDGWSYIVPEDTHVLRPGVVTEHFADEADDHIWDQAETIKSLYLSNRKMQSFSRRSSSNVGNENNSSNGSIDVDDKGNKLLFVSRRGQEVLGCATFVKDTGRLQDVVVRPSARRSSVGTDLVNSVKDYITKTECTDQIIVHISGDDSRQFFGKQGFIDAENFTMVFQRNL